MHDVLQYRFYSKENLQEDESVEEDSDTGKVLTAAKGEFILLWKAMRIKRHGPLTRRRELELHDDNGA